MEETIEHIKAPMRVKDVLSAMFKCAQGYRKVIEKDFKKSGKQKQFNQEATDAIIVDFINFNAYLHWTDYELCAVDLKKEEETLEEKLPHLSDMALVRKGLTNFARFYRKKGILESVKNNKHTNECVQDFSQDFADITLAGYINYFGSQYNEKFRVSVDELKQKPVW